MAINGTFYGATSNGWIKPRITWSAITNTEGNYSDVTATLAYTRTNTGYTTAGYWSGKLAIGENAKSTSGMYVQIKNGTYTTVITHTARIYHDADGTKTITISATGAVSDTTLTHTSIAADVALEAITRAASIGATDADIGSVSMVSIGRRSQQHTHVVAYRFGSLQGYLTADGLSNTPVQLTQTALAFSLPESFYYEIPNAPTGVCTLTCTTYREDDVVGTPQQTTFTVRADPNKCAPTLTATAVDINPVTLALTGNEHTVVRYASQVLCSLSGTGRFGATVVDKKIAGMTVTGDLLLDAVDSVVFSLRDSRGYVTEQTVALTMLPYHQPTGRMTAARTDATSGNVDIQAQGSWFSGSFGKFSNTLQARCRAGEGTWKTLTVQTDGDGYTLTGRLSGLSYTDAHRITLEISDQISTLTLSAQINPGIPTFHWGKEDFCFQVPVQAPKLTGLSAPGASTDAANKAYVDTAIATQAEQIQTKTAMVLLWENASPTSSFVAQTISLNLTEYAFVDVYFAKANNDPANWICYRMPIGYAGDPFHLSHIQNTSRASVVGSRHTVVTTAGVEFGNGFYKYTSSNTGGTENESMIPYKIYGITGVTE